MRKLISLLCVLVSVTCIGMDTPPSQVTPEHRSQTGQGLGTKKQVISDIDLYAADVNDKVQLAAEKAEQKGRQEGIQQARKEESLKRIIMSDYRRFKRAYNDKPKGLIEFKVSRRIEEYRSSCQGVGLNPVTDALSKFKRDDAAIRKLFITLFTRYWYGMYEKPII